MFLNIAVLLILIEALIGIVLLNANREYKRENRNLIIQNDSILSANLQLSRQMIDSTQKLSVSK